MLYCGFQAGALEGAVRDLVQTGALARDFAAFRVDRRAVVVACAMRTPPSGGDICCPGPLSPGPALAFGATPLEFLRCAAGKGTSPASARAGGRSWTDVRRGLVACEGPAGGMTQVMAGVAFAFQRRGQSRAALVFEDRRAVETGRWHEGMSFATALRVPLIVVLASVPGAQASAFDPAAAAANYGLEAVSLAGEPLSRVHERVAAARRRAVEGGGPSLLDLGPRHVDDEWNETQLAEWPGGGQVARRRAEKAAVAAVQSAVARLAAEPAPQSADALASALSDAPMLPHWTRDDPPNPGARRPALAGHERFGESRRPEPPNPGDGTHAIVGEPGSGHIRPSLPDPPDAD